MPTLETYKGVYLWHYVPSLPAAIVFATLFGLATAAHGWKMVRTKQWFCTPFIIGGIFEVIGYVARAFSTDATGALGPYTIQAIFLVLPPTCFAATLYMVYSRVVRAVGDGSNSNSDGARFSLTPLRWTTIIFVVGDWTTLNVQSTGSGLLANAKLAHVGEDIIVAGLGLQVLVFVAFVVCCVAFNVRYRAHLRGRTAPARPLPSSSGQGRQRRDEWGDSGVPWQACLNMLYATSLAILVRNAYRIVEFVMGQDGYLLGHEWATYAFDGTLMLLVMVAFYIWHPASLCRGAGQESMIRLDSARTSSAERGAATKAS